ncbi:putative FAD/NAD(P)-binding domain protein [Tanacetum coccineum]
MEDDDKVVIIGAGICGLAMSLALHRKGIRSVVYEKSESLGNDTGAAIRIWKNGWRALDQLGVADILRLKAPLIKRFLLTLRKKWVELKGYDAIVIKWKHSIHPKIAAFSVVYDSVQRMDESGSSNLTLFQKALAEFEMQYEHPFTMEACWRILKNHPAWTKIEMANQRRNNEV